jgi:hypothetical protein
MLQFHFMQIVYSSSVSFFGWLTALLFLAAVRGILLLETFPPVWFYVMNKRIKVLKNITEAKVQVG